MTGQDPAIEAAGDPRHPDHEAWLLELGRATYAASRVAGVSFDILRVFDGISSHSMYSDPLGILLKRIQSLKSRRSDLPGLNEFAESLDASRTVRNDLIHALPVKDGLHRRMTNDRAYVHNFYSVEDVRSAVTQLEATWRIGSHLLYHDGGEAVRAWIAGGQ
ncbi:MAG TPA: hypothetical protein VNR36_08165 [Pseudolysinimonas sp.]|nr:hypothetical protein [Pseudolysinimonas sp.]